MKTSRPNTLLVTGTRRELHAQDKYVIRGSLENFLGVQMVIHGGCSGVDLFVDEWARFNGIHVAEVKALWDYYRNPAGARRNRMMLKWLQPDFVLAFPACDSKGTRHCIAYAQECNVPTKVVELDA